jgi:uncharacterized membrane protein
VAYLPGMWRDFGVTVAGLAGALTGLLFVTVSLKSEVLARSRSLRSRAAQTLVLFMTAAIAAIMLVAPQSRQILGAELLALAAVSGIALLIFDQRAGHDPDSGVARYIERASPNSITAVLVGLAGLTLLLKAGGGLYWLIPAVLASLVGGVINAWLFLLNVPDRTGDLPGADGGERGEQDGDAGEGDVRRDDRNGRATHGRRVIPGPGLDRRAGRGQEYQAYTQAGHGEQKPAGDPGQASEAGGQVADPGQQADEGQPEVGEVQRRASPARLRAAPPDPSDPPGHHRHAQADSDQPGDQRRQVERGLAGRA